MPLTATTATLAQKIASAARYGANDVGSSCLADIDPDGLRVTQHQWQHLPRRAKALGARWEQGRGWHGSADGKAWGEVVASDGSRCVVILVG